MNKLIRVWKEMDVENISKHLLIVGISTGDCSSCRELGIKYSEATHCPGCGTVFKYIATRTKDIKRIKEKRSDLTFIDFEDYKKATGQNKAQELFGF